MEAVKKRRIWEVDALRGLMILCVPVAHALYYGDAVLGLFRVPTALNEFLFGWAGSLFVLLSGLSATLGSKSFRRGLIVFGCGMLLTLGSMLAVCWGLVDDTMIIRFGVLHLLGACMLLYPLLRRLPNAALVLFGALCVGLGFWFETLTVEPGWLYPFGLRRADFSSGDYFPLFPQLGWFCFGVVLGRLCYPEKRTLLPQVNENLWILRFLRFCGRHSLLIFVLHLPVVAGITYGLALLLGKL